MVNATLYSINLFMYCNCSYFMYLKMGVKRMPETRTGTGCIWLFSDKATTLNGQVLRRLRSDAVSTARYRWKRCAMNWKRTRGQSTHSPFIHLERLDKTTKYVSEDSRCPGQDSNQKKKSKSCPCALFLNEHHAMKAYWWSRGIAPRILWPRQ
jgi:hypothetical protein